jgi:hypothetical protein
MRCRPGVEAAASRPDSGTTGDGDFGGDRNDSGIAASVSVLAPRKHVARGCFSEEVRTVVSDRGK